MRREIDVAAVDFILRPRLSHLARQPARAVIHSGICGEAKYFSGKIENRLVSTIFSAT
jgi:hypothetical protein